MNVDTILMVGIAVTAFLVIGLFLTYKEFRDGQPNKQNSTSYVPKRTTSSSLHSVSD